MQQEINSDRSTLAFLQPYQAFDIRWHDFRNAPRYQGSHLLSLRRPTRLPEASRKYVHGDPVKMIDWKAFARTDQLIMRVQRDEASVKVRVVIDISETMQWPTREVLHEAHRQVPTKAEVAFRIGLNLAHAHVKIGDIVEIWLVESQGRPSLLLQPRSPADIVGQFRQVLSDGFEMKSMCRAFAEGAFPQVPADVLYWIGDGLSDQPVNKLLKACKRSAMVHLLSSLELDVSWLEFDRSYFDESLQRKEFQGQILLAQNNYSNSLQTWLNGIQTRVTNSGGMYVRVTDTTPIHQFYRQLNFFS